MKSSTEIISIVNQKGGTAKTTTAENLGIGLVREGKRVLLVDTDPQANLTSCLGWKNVDALEATVSDVIEGSINKTQPFFSQIILHHDEGVGKRQITCTCKNHEIFETVVLKTHGFLGWR